MFDEGANTRLLELTGLKEGSVAIPIKITTPATTAIEIIFVRDSLDDFVIFLFNE